MNRPLWLVLGTLAGAAALFGAGWAVKGLKDSAALAEAKAATTHQLDSIAQVHAHQVDSLNAATAVALALAARDSAEAARLRQAAAGHAAADHAQDAALAAARTAADSLPIVVAQRDESRLAYLGAVAADSTARKGARETLASRLGLAEGRRLADSTAAAAREASLQADNASLALRLANAGERKKWLGFIPAPQCGPGLAATVGAAFVQGVDRKWKAGAGLATGAALACIIPL